MVIIFIIAAVWILGILAALALSIASRRLDSEVALDRQLARTVGTRSDLAV